MARAALLLALLLTTAAAQADEKPAPKPKPKPLHARRAAFEKVAGGFRFTEGPAADKDGNLVFSDIPNERIHRLDVQTGKVTVLREQSGRANGLAFDAGGALIACEGGGRRLVRITQDAVTVLAERWDGKRLNSPNDLAIDPGGGIWFTDPRYGKQDDREIDVQAVYYRAADGTLTRPISDLEKPNGILLSGDAKTLYVADNARKLVMAYALTAPGKPAKGRVFARLAARMRGGPDGMTRDERGNVYCAGQGMIWIWDASGRLLELLRPPESPSNCAFGGADRRTLFVTARTALYRFPMYVRG